MATTVADRVLETSTTTGTGSVTLAGASAGYRTFNAALSSGVTVPYCIEDGTDWEVGLGTFTSPSTLARTTVQASSNAGALVSFAAGTKRVFCTLTAGSGIVFSSGATMAGALNEAPQATIASAATVAIGAAAANSVTISGTTTITAFDTIATGARRAVVFSGILTLTHNATSLILPGAASITTAAGDCAEFVSLGAGGWRCIDYQKASGAAVAGGGGGLTNFTDGLSTSTPNATIPVASLTATNAATSIDFAILPKLNGAILAGIPDSAAAGGNKRGTNAVDFQLVRSAAASVASGTRAALIGGLNNVASGTDSAVLSGSQNTASQLENVVLGGQSNNCGGSYRNAILGGIGNSITSGWESVAGGAYNAISGSQYQCVVFGNSNVANGSGNSNILLGTSNTTSSTAGTYMVALGKSNSVQASYAVALGVSHSNDGYGSVALGSNTYMRGRKHFLLFGAGAGAAGFDDCHLAMTNLVIQTTDAATTKTLTSDGATGAATNQLSGTSGVTQATFFRAQVLGLNSAGTAAVAFSVEGVVRGSTLVGTPTVTQIAADTALSSCTCTVVAGASLVSIRVNGVAATTINWSAAVFASYAR